MRRPCLIAACAVLFPTVGAAAQAGSAPRDTLPAPVFRTAEPLALTLTADLRALAGDDAGEPEWRDAALAVAGAGGASDSLTIRVRPRGHFRRTKCDLPPLRLDLPRKRAEATPLAGLNKPKLVVHCENSDAFEQYVVREYLLYRMYALLTPLSQRARLVRVTYRDAAGRRAPVTRAGILVEEEEAVAARTGLRLLELTGAGPDDVDAYQSALVGVFEYLIGNTDWSIYALHNIALLQSARSVFPMAYDFDWSGAVDARYATPDPRLGTRTVRERLYRGYCTTQPRWPEVFAHVLAQREAILALVRDEPALSADSRSRLLRYLGDGFAVIADPARAEREIVRACRR